MGRPGQSFQGESVNSDEDAHRRSVSEDFAPHNVPPQRFRRRHGLHGVGMPVC